jgi:glycosyltransferase involved in cell wall biosynthesis
MTNISVIIPVYKLDDTTKPLFNNAVKSVETQKTVPDELILVIGKDDSESIEYIKSFDFGSISNIITIVLNDGDTDFQSQVNLGVSKAKSEWVSILEQDDEYSSIYFKNVVEYRAAHPNVDLFMPIIVDVDANGTFISLCNEATWAQSFSDELGILDLNALLAYQNFNIDGITIKKDVYEEHGGLKPSIKLTFIYEFFLRMTFKDVRVMVIPKFGYKHVNQRPNSLFVTYKETMDPVEAKWWLGLAKREYFFEKDRKITYSGEIS